MKKKIIYTIMLISAIAVYFSCSYVPKLNGIDISHHNVVDWKKIRKNKDIEFCYIKATEGKSFRDPMCKKQAKRAKAIGLHVGLYHYFRTDVPAEKQFANFKSVYDKVPSNLIPVIDVVENGNDFSNISIANKRLKKLIELFEQEYGCKPIVYTGSWCCLKVITAFYDCPIWLRLLHVPHILPNTTIKQAAIINNLDMNYCKDINDIIL